MAFFEGTLEDFYKYLGPRTSDIVTRLARPNRKVQKTCRQPKDDGTTCGKWKGLDAAHLKGRERKILIEEILEEFALKLKKNDNKQYYKIAIKDFEEEFEKKHKDFFNVIEFMCRKHHKAYDAKNKVLNNEDDYVEVEQRIAYNDIAYNDIDSKKVKTILINNIDYLNNNNCSIARISNDNWNFNIEKTSTNSDFYLLCFDQLQQSVVILKIEANQLETDKLIKKSKPTKISLNIPYSEEQFIEKKTACILEFMEHIKLQLI